MGLSLHPHYCLLFLTHILSSSFLFTITISITIAPDGSVTACSVVSSSFNNPDFEQKLRQRIMLFHFLPKAVPPFTYGTYPIDFHPM